MALYLPKSLFGRFELASESIRRTDGCQSTLLASSIVSELWSWVTQHIVLSVVIAVVGLLLVLGGLAAVTGGQVDRTKTKPVIKPINKSTIYLLLAIGVGVAVGVGWLLWGQVAAAPPARRKSKSKLSRPR